MFTNHQHVGSSRLKHRNKMFYRIGVATDYGHNHKVFAVEDGLTTLLFHKLTTIEEQQLIQAIKLLDTDYDKGEKIIIKFFEGRYQQGGMEAKQLEELMKKNSYYAKVLSHFKNLEKSDSKKQEYIYLTPEKRKTLTEGFRTADQKGHEFAPDFLFKSIDPSQMYNRTPTPTADEMKDEATEALTPRLSTSSFSEELSSPLNKRSKGGFLMWDSLEERYTLSSVPDPVFTPITTQDDTANKMMEAYMSSKKSKL